MASTGAGLNKTEIVKQKTVFTAAEVKKELKFLRPDVAEYVERGPLFSPAQSCGLTFKQMFEALTGRTFLQPVDEATHYLMQFYNYQLATLDRTGGGHTLRKHVESSNRFVWDRIAHNKERSTSATTRYSEHRTAELSVFSCLNNNCGNILKKLYSWIQWRDAPGGKKDFFMKIRSEMDDLDVGFGYVGLADGVTARRSFSSVTIHLSVVRRLNLAEISSSYPEDPAISTWEVCTSNNLVEKVGSRFQPTFMLIPVYFDMVGYWTNLEAEAAAVSDGIVWKGWEIIIKGGAAKRSLDLKKSAEVNVDNKAPLINDEKKTADDPSVSSGTPIAQTSDTAKSTPEKVPVPGPSKATNVDKDQKNEGKKDEKTQTTTNSSKTATVQPEIFKIKTSCAVQVNGGEINAQDPSKPSENVGDVKKNEPAASSIKDSYTEDVRLAMALIEKIATEHVESKVELLLAVARRSAAGITCPTQPCNITAGESQVHPAPVQKQHASGGCEPAANLNLQQQGQHAGASKSLKNQSSGSGEFQGQSQQAGTSNASRTHDERWSQRGHSGYGNSGGQPRGMDRQQQQYQRYEMQPTMSGAPSRENLNRSAPSHMNFFVRTVPAMPELNRLSLSYTTLNSRVHVGQEGGLIFPDLLGTAQNYQARGMEASISHGHYPRQRYGSQQITGNPIPQQPPAIGWSQGQHQSPQIRHQQRFGSLPSYPAETSWLQNSQMRRVPSGDQLGGHANRSFRNPQGDFGPMASTPLHVQGIEQSFLFGASPVQSGHSPHHGCFGGEPLQFGSPLNTSTLTSPSESNVFIQSSSPHEPWDRTNVHQATASNQSGGNESGASNVGGGSNNPYWQQ